MEIEDLPEELRELVEELKEGSSTIQCNVDDALDIAEDLEDFEERVSCEMTNLIAEAQTVMNTLGKKKDNSKPEIVIVIKGGSVQAIATAGQSMMVRVIDYDQKNVGESYIANYEPDVVNIDTEQYTKEMMEE